MSKGRDQLEIITGVTRAQARQIIKARRGELARIVESVSVVKSVVLEFFDGRNSNEEVAREVKRRLVRILAEDPESAKQLVA